MRGTLGTEGSPRFKRLVRLTLWLIPPAWVLILFAIGWGLWSPPARPVPVMPSETPMPRATPSPQPSLYVGNPESRVNVMPSETPMPRATLSPQPGPFVGDIAPDFRLPTLDGGITALSDYRGHRVLVNFFTTWCEPCRAEMPGLEAQAQKHAADGWVVLGVDIMESRGALSAFQAEFGLTFPLLRDENADVARQYLVTGTPTSLFIDRTGRVVELRLGYTSETELTAIIESMP